MHSVVYVVCYFSIFSCFWATFPTYIVQMLSFHTCRTRCDLFVCQCVYVFDTLVSCAKTAEPIEISFGGRGLKEPCITWFLDPAWERAFLGGNVKPHCKLPPDGCTAHC